MEGQAPAQPASEADVLSRLSAYFSQEPASEAEEQQAPAEDESAPEPQAAESDAGEEKEQAGDETEDAKDSVTIDPDAPLIEITVKTEGGGEETKLWSLNEMKAGVMMHKDYQRKTAELAKARESLQFEVQKAVEPERAAYQQSLQQLQATIEALVLPEFQGVDWQRLASENPAQYVQLSAKWQQSQQLLQYAQVQQQQQQQQAFSQAAEHSRQMLNDPIAGIPGWSDQVYSTLIQEGAKAYGFNPQEVAQVVDWRQIKVLHDALAYRKVAAAKPAVEKKISVAPKVLKPGAQSESSDAQARKEKDLTQRLKRSGSLEDATALYLARQQRKR